MKNVLIILGFPLWFPLLITAFAVALVLYVVLLTVLITFWALSVSLAVSGAALTVFGIVVAVGGELFTGLMTVGVGLVAFGTSLLLFVLSKVMTDGLVALTKKCLRRN